ncbi:selenocysteine-specific translation elongation factor [Synergistales bacterium]|nr:selenocysteine-specific translation elongation factor [Synergistales bacterium]
MSELKEISLVLGTAGHIDHGKTALVKALTGVDCDRLIEEKKRGITIELGFAPLRLDDDRVVSVIDVPGHERFIRQMVAGASGVDAILLVVAADEGVMPQTREHLAILELLGVRDGVVALTKSDRVDAEMLELARDDVGSLIKNTFLDGKNIVAVSAVSGQNLGELKKELAALVDRVRPRARKGALFLPIDRAFPISGFGTVITGTAYRGVAHIGDEVEVLPLGTNERKSKIRSIQVHSHPVEEAYAGQRVAANLSGIAVDELSRGDTVCQKGVYFNTRAFDAFLKVLPSADIPLKHWQRLRLYIGTSDVLARVSLFESRSIAPGEEAPAQIIVEEDIVCMAEQRFIIRFYSPLVTIGGGRVIMPYAHKPRGSAARKQSSERIRALSRATSTHERLAILVESLGTVTFEGAATSLQEPKGDLEAIAKRMMKEIAPQKGIVELRDDSARAETSVYVSKARLLELVAEIVADISAYHKSYESEDGIPIDKIKASRPLLSLLAEMGTIILEKGKAHLPDFVPKNDEVFLRNSKALFAACDGLGFQPPTLEELREKIHMEQKPFSLLVQSLKNSGRIVILSDGYLLTDEIEKKMKDILRKIDGTVTLAAVRDITGSSRKFILPILEYFDSKGWTRRVGDARVIKKEIKEGVE